MVPSSRAIMLHDVDNDGCNELLVASSSGTVSVFKQGELKPWVTTDLFHEGTLVLLGFGCFVQSNPTIAAVFADGQILGLAHRSTSETDELHICAGGDGPLNSVSVVTMPSHPIEAALVGQAAPASSTPDVLVLGTDSGDLVAVTFVSLTVTNGLSRSVMPSRKIPLRSVRRFACSVTALASLEGGAQLAAGLSDCSVAVLAWPSGTVLRTSAAPLLGIRPLTTNAAIWPTFSTAVRGITSASTGRGSGNSSHALVVATGAGGAAFVDWPTRSSAPGEPLLGGGGSGIVGAVVGHMDEKVNEPPLASVFASLGSLEEPALAAAPLTGARFAICTQSGCTALIDCNERSSDQERSRSAAATTSTNGGSAIESDVDGAAAAGLSMPPPPLLPCVVFNAGPFFGGSPLRGFSAGCFGPCRRDEDRRAHACLVYALASGELLVFRGEALSQVLVLCPSSPLSLRVCKQDVVVLIMCKPQLPSFLSFYLFTTVPRLGLFSPTSKYSSSRLLRWPSLRRQARWWPRCRPWPRAR